MFFDSILFDLDDTLHDRNRSLIKFIDIFILKYCLVMENSIDFNIKNIFLEIDRRGYRPREEMLKELQNRISWVNKPNIQELLEFWNSEFPICAEPMPDLYRTLDYFREKNVKMGIVTNGGSLFQHTKIEKLDLGKYMKSIIISEEISMRKPDKRIFLYALSQLESEGNSTIFVGDSPSLDIKGAIDAGLVSVWLKNGEAWDNYDYRPNYIISNISELINLR